MLQTVTLIKRESVAKTRWKATKTQNFSRSNFFQEKWFNEFSTQVENIWKAQLNGCVNRHQANIWLRSINCCGWVKYSAAVLSVFHIHASWALGLSLSWSSYSCNIRLYCLHMSLWNTWGAQNASKIITMDHSDLFANDSFFPYFVLFTGSLPIAFLI